MRSLKKNKTTLPAWPTINYFPDTRNFSLDFEPSPAEGVKTETRFLVVPPNFSENSKWVDTEARELDGKVGILLAPTV